MRRLVLWLLVLWPGVSWAVDVYVNPPPADPLKLRERAGADIPAVSAAGQCVYYADAVAHVLYESCNGGAYHAIASGPTPTLNLIEGAAPALSAAGMCVIYADNATHDVTLSCNGEAYSGVVTQAIGNTIYFRLDATNDPITGTTSWNTGAGTDLALQEDTIDRASGGAETLLITNSGAGAMTVTMDNLVVSEAAAGGVATFNSNSMNQTPATSVVISNGIASTGALDFHASGLLELQDNWWLGGVPKINRTRMYTYTPEGSWNHEIFRLDMSGEAEVPVNVLQMERYGPIGGNVTYVYWNGAQFFINSGGNPDLRLMEDTLSRTSAGNVSLYLTNLGAGDLLVTPDQLVVLGQADLRSIVVNTTAANSGLLDFNDGATFDGPLQVTGGTITANAPTLAGTQTWNNAGVPFYGIVENVTNTASAATSRLLSLQVASTPQMDVDPTGSVRIVNDYLSYTAPTTTVGIFNGAESAMNGGNDYLGVVVPPDLLPVYVYINNTAVVAKKCNTAYCTAPTTIAVDSGAAAQAPAGACLQADGSPFLVYQKNSNLWVGSCSDVNCTVVTTYEFVTAATDGENPTCTGFADGTVGLAYKNLTSNNVEYILCPDPKAVSPCGTAGAAVVMSDAYAGTTYRPAIVTVGDQTPLLGWVRGTWSNFTVTKCATTACAGTTVTTITPGGNLMGATGVVRAGTGFGAFLVTNNGNNAFVLDCTNLACSTSNVRTYSGVAIGVASPSSMGIGADDIPFLSVYTSGSLSYYVPCTTTTCSGFGSATLYPSPGMTTEYSTGTATTYTTDRWVVGRHSTINNYNIIVYIPYAIVPTNGTDVCASTSKCANGFFAGDLTSRVSNSDSIQLSDTVTDPYYPYNGRMWQNSTVDQLRVRLNGTTRDVLQSQAWTEVAVSIPDSGTGAHATYTLTPAWHGTWVFTCLDGDGCDVTISEASASSGQRIDLYNDSAANVVYILRIAAQVETPGDANVALSLDDSAQFEYAGARTLWRYRGGANNH